jgi:hypothetical protein
MIDKPTHINPDSFNENIKGKLANHTMPVDTELWSKIERDLQTTKKRRLPVWLWVSIGSAAIITLLLISRSNIYLQKNDSMKETLSLNAGSSKQDIHAFKSGFHASNSIQSAQIEGTKKQFVREHKHMRKDFIASRHYDIQENTGKNKPYINDTVSTITEKDPNRNKTLTEKVDSGNMNRRIFDLRLADKDFKTGSVPQTQTKKSASKHKNSGWMIAGLIMSGNNFSQSNTLYSKQSEATNNYSTVDENNQPVFVSEKTVTVTTPTTITTLTSTASTTYYLATTGGNSTTTSTTETSSSTTTNYLSINTTEPDKSLFSDIKYQLPLSTGFKIGKKISNNANIESGLIYTYLQTNLTGEDIDAEYQLHYLGIPLNFRYTVWNIKKLYFNLSAGIMAEKGLQSKYCFRQYKTTGNIDKTTTSGIDGMQWSANSAIDISYLFIPHYSLYFDPQLSYYFDNNQPLSIRTKQNFVFGLQLGLRYDF